MTTENRPKLTLGLKKKSKQPQDDAQTQQKSAKLSLGLRKKPALLQPQDGAGDAQERSSRLTLGSRKKQEFIPQSVAKSQRPFVPRPSPVRMPKTPGRLEVNIKITELPNWVETIKRGWRRFCVNVEGQVVEIKVRPKAWEKLLKANEEYPMWMASITGKMGTRIKNGFALLEPAVQVYERKPKAPKEPEAEE
ncbi:MAG: hypothetical protein DRR08_22070 [Candidatus Parabeggiatoa sp. nov. 2]|nr:MAG: hypothetical protein B6247_10335 [Beggiatoa sp. 4572_84]RKZ56317.1 MAG: hypothetical protein DRR08_22070 [Gammaproteobacteria bacterium]